MERKGLNIFTKVSFFTALVAIIFIPISVYISTGTSNENVESILQVFALAAFYATLLGIPLSIVSMFSKENLTKRIFALVINLLPVGFIVFAFIMEFIKEFSETPP